MAALAANQPQPFQSCPADVAPSDTGALWPLHEYTRALLVIVDQLPNPGSECGFTGQLAQIQLRRPIAWDCVMRCVTALQARHPVFPCHAARRWCAACQCADYCTIEKRRRARSSRADKTKPLHLGATTHLTHERF